MYRILLSLFILLGTIMPAQASSTFTNPILGDGADPWVVRHDDGFYYYTQTTGSDITLWRTKDITDLENAERKVVWMPAQGAVNGTHLWAPELHLLDGRWYIYIRRIGWRHGSAAHVCVAVKRGGSFWRVRLPCGYPGGKDG